MSGEVDLLADARWRVLATDAGGYDNPDTLPPDTLPADTLWADALVPGTVASVDDRPEPESYDWWYSTTVTVPDDAPSTLTFGGIATRATVWLNGSEVATSRSMFVPVRVDVPGGMGEVRVSVRVESLDAHVKRRRPRGRWRSSLIAQQGLRHERTSLLGRAPVYGPLDAPIGLWRPVMLTSRRPFSDVQVHTSLDGATGILRVRADLEAAQVSGNVRISGEVFPIEVNGTTLDATVEFPGVEPWWPHTHGTPRLYDVTVEIGGVELFSGPVGFRSAELMRDGRDVALKINGHTVFARGGCWVPLDPTRLWVGCDVLRAELTRIRDAGLNMVRVVGTMVYEQPEFWSLCSELGIMVWQDVMFATTDPPEDDEFLALVSAEVVEFASAVGGNPALAVVSGGSETQQQPTMLGVPHADQSILLLDTVIPRLIEDVLPGTPYVTSSPSSMSGELHTHVGDGIAHYFGVGGYLRPLSDVRTARVRFAAESLAFAVPPERRSVDAFFGAADVAGHHPDWKAAVPRDRGSSWDFEDVRDHYVREIFGVDPHLIRRTDAELYLDYGRAAVCEAVTACYTEWRRIESDCSGALVLTLRDLVPGAGWGLTDSSGRVKAPWYALARANAPIAVIVVDNGLDGMSFDLLNDTSDVVDGTLRATLFGMMGPLGEAHETAVKLQPRSGESIALDRLIGAFADVNHAYRFGAQTYSAVVAEIVDNTGVVVAQSTVLIGDAHARQNDVGLSAIVTESAPATWSLTVTTKWAAQYVCIDVDSADVADSWFHLAPGAERTVVVTGKKPSGHVRALNSIRRAQIV